MGLDGPPFEDIALEQDLEAQEVQNDLTEVTDITQYLSKLPQELSKENQAQLQKDIWEFALQSLSGKIGGETGDLNISEFDNDGEVGLDAFEFNAYMESLNMAIEAIVLTGGVDEYIDIRKDAADDATTWVSRNIESNISWGIEKAFDFIGDGVNIESGELEQMKQQDFSLVSVDSWTVLAAEIGTGVKDLIEFFANIPSAIYQFEDYRDLREMRDSTDPAESKEGELRISAMIEENPALGLAEISLESLEQLWDLMTSGTNEGVALAVVSTIGLLAGGAGVIKLGTSLARKSAIKSARNMGAEARGGEEAARRATLRSRDKSAGIIKDVIDTVDNTITSGGVNIASGALLGKSTEVTTNEKPIAANDNMPQASERTQKYDTVEAYEAAGGNATEYGYVDTNGVLHVNTAELAKLDPETRRTEMKELVAHERAHQALMNQEAGTVGRMNEVFIRNDVYADCAEYVDYARVENPLDAANELFATMVGRLRVGKKVPQSFIDAMVEGGFAKIDPQTGRLDLSEDFGVEAARNGWVENGGVVNPDGLNEAAMSRNNAQLHEVVDYDGGVPSMDQLLTLAKEASESLDGDAYTLLRVRYDDLVAALSGKDIPEILLPQILAYKGSTAGRFGEELLRDFPQLRDTISGEFGENLVHNFEAVEAYRLEHPNLRIVNENADSYVGMYGLRFNRHTGVLEKIPGDRIVSDDVYDLSNVPEYTLGEPPTVEQLMKMVENNDMFDGDRTMLLSVPYQDIVDCFRGGKPIPESVVASIVEYGDSLGNRLPHDLLRDFPQLEESIITRYGAGVREDLHRVSDFAQSNPDFNWEIVDPHADSYFGRYGLRVDPRSESGELYMHIPDRIIDTSVQQAA